MTMTPPSPQGDPTTKQEPSAKDRLRSLELRAERDGFAQTGLPHARTLRVRYLPQARYLSGHPTRPSVLVYGLVRASDGERTISREEALALLREAS